MNTLIPRPVKLSRKAQWTPGQGRGNAVDMKYLGPISLVGEVLGAQIGFLLLYVVKIIAGPRFAVTVLNPRDLGGPIGLEATQTRSTGVKDLHREPSGAGSVGKQLIAMTTTVPGAAALKIR